MSAYLETTVLVLPKARGTTENWEIGSGRMHRAHGVGSVLAMVDLTNVGPLGRAVRCVPRCAYSNDIQHFLAY